MYAEFFGLRELPFNNTPDPRFFFSTADHEEALASLIYAVRERKGFVLLTGEVGAGKTLVSRMMLRHFGAHISFAAISHGVHDASDLMEAVLTELELEHKPRTSNAQMVRILQDYLLSQFAQNKPVVLMLDEAQNLPTDAFEQLRMIGNLEADDAKLLQIVIVGQPELQSMFASRELRQLRQRIFRSFHLPALSREDTENYILHRLRIAGAERDDIFASGAIDRIYRNARGLPRLINAICDNALLSAYAADRREIDGEMIEGVARQMMMIDEQADAAAPQPSPRAVQPPAVAHERSALTRPASSGSALQRPVPRPSQRTHAPTRSAPPPHRMNPPRVKSDTATALDSLMTEKLEEFESRLRLRMRYAEQRLQRSEEFSRTGPSVDAEARATLEQLKPLVDTAREATERGQATIQNIAGKEASARKLAARLDGLMGELGDILDSLKAMTARARSEEQSAGDVLERLTTQTRRSRDLADKLAGIVVQLKSDEGAPPQRVVKSAQALATDLTANETAPINAEAVESQLEDVMTQARESFNSLRQIAREQRGDFAPSAQGTADRGPASPGRSIDRSTSRLEAQVQGLLDLVQQD